MPATSACRRPRGVSSRSSSGLESCGTASPCRSSQSCDAISAGDYAARAKTAGSSQASRPSTAYRVPPFRLGRGSGAPRRREHRVRTPMAAIVDTSEEAAALEQPPLLVRRPLEAFLDARGLGAGPLAAEPVGEGHSNVRVLIRRAGGGGGRRRPPPPPPPPLPPSAHDVLREAFLLRALEHTDVRVPRVLAACEDPAVIGAPFYVMERVHGHVMT